MFDYLERTSLKFHIEEFLKTNTQIPYRIKNYYIDLSQNDNLLHVHITDLKLRSHNSPSYTRTISFHINNLNFEHLLNNVNHTLKQFEQTRKEKR